MDTVQYMGSKRSLLKFIDDSLEAYKMDFPDFTYDSFLDGFTGSVRVANHFSNRAKVITNDKLSFCKTIANAVLKNTTPLSFYIPFLQEFNFLDLREWDYLVENGTIDGFFAKNYSGEYNDGSSVDPETGVRKIWSIYNGKCIDLILYKISQYNLTEVQRDVLLYSLLCGISKISNCCGHQNGYLKNWSKASQNALFLELPDIKEAHRFDHETYQGPILSNILDEIKVDLAYFDPPYGTNNKNLSTSTRYSSFYHLYNTIVESKNFDRPEIFGKAGKPLSTKGFTEYLEQNKVEPVLYYMSEVLVNCNCKYACMSYSNKGLLTAEDLFELFSASGYDMSTYRLYIKEHKVNPQKCAKKEGLWIDRSNSQDSLYEYFIIAKKKEWPYAVPEEVYYDKENRDYSIPGYAIKL